MAGLAAVVRRPLPSFHGPAVAAATLARPHSSGGSDDYGSPASEGTTTPPSPCAGVQIPPALLGETPTRKNKRKLSEPRKRGSDLSVKRRCPDSPGGSAMSESGGSDDGGKRVSLPPQRCRRRPARRRTCHDDRDDTSSRGPSERGDTPTPGPVIAHHGGHNGRFPPGHRSGNAPAPHHHRHPHPFFQVGFHPAACFVPGFYEADAGRAGYPPVPFPGVVPLGHLTHPVFPPGLERGRGGAGAGSTCAAPVLEAGHERQRGQDGVGGPYDGRGADFPDKLSGDEDSADEGSGGGRRSRKNYKNMTRERRVEANARERTRVHTISAAFEALRRSVPSYSYNQKLSKLAILKIAGSYIMALARLADVDCSQVSEPSIPVTFADCVDLCTRTIQTEGRARRRQ